MEKKWWMVFDHCNALVDVLGLSEMCAAIFLKNLPHCDVLCLSGQKVKVFVLTLGLAGSKYISSTESAMAVTSRPCLGD